MTRNGKKFRQTQPKVKPKSYGKKPNEQKWTNRWCFIDQIAILDKSSSMSSVKWKKYHLLSEKTKFSIFFGSRNRLACFIEKNFVLHLRLCLRQKCTDIFLGIKELVVYKKKFSEDVPEFAEKTEKNSQNSSEKSRSKSAKIRTTSCSCFLDQMAFVQYSVSTSHQNGKKYHLYSGKSFFLSFFP